MEVEKREKDAQHHQSHDSHGIVEHTSSGEYRL